jgi:hypothetical protein
MPAPILWFGAAALALLASAKYSKDKSVTKSNTNLPEQSNILVIPVNGSIVSCSVFGLFDHTGIWVDGNIIELKGNGLIRGISPSRFLHERSGDEIFIACDRDNKPIACQKTAARATAMLFQYSEYDVVKNNCHKFVWCCISNEDAELTRFSVLNEKLSVRFGSDIIWQKAAVENI